MIKTASWALVFTASIGVMNVPHALFYQHPELIFREYAEGLRLLEGIALA